jgi:hypothetical protein
MALTAAFAIVAVLFCLKILWNFSVPYVLVNAPAGRGISLLPVVELVLLGIGVTVAAFEPWHYGTRRVVLWGLGLTVGSYLHMLIAGFLVGWLTRGRRRPSAN